MPSLLLRGLKSDLLESRKPGMHDRQAALQQFITTADPRIRSVRLLIDTSVARDSGYACFAYLNYEDEGETASGKLLLDSAIFLAVTRKSSVDASHMVVCTKADAPKRNWAPVFSIWVGNLFDADVSNVKECFNRFGPLSTMAIHGLPPFRILECRSQRSAIFNYINFADAQAAFDARKSISFGAAPAVIRPRANMLFVQQVLRVDRGRQMPFDQIQRIADRLGEERPDDCIALLRMCRDLFVVDMASGLVSRR